MPTRTQSKAEQSVGENVSDISSLLIKLDKKMDAVDAKIDSKIDSLAISIQSELSKTLEGFRSNIEAEVKSICDAQSERITSVESTIVDMDRISKLNDVIIRGVMLTESENLLSVFKAICDSIKFKCNTNYCVNNIFRLGRANTSPILVQFVTQLSKRNFMVKYFAKKDLNLSHIGVNNNKNRIYCSDNLSAINNNIYMKAM